MTENTTGNGRSGGTSGAGGRGSAPGNNGIINSGSGHVTVGPNSVIGRGAGNNGIINSSSGNVTVGSNTVMGVGNRTAAAAKRSRTEYQTVNLGGRQVRVARNLSERTNDRRGYCRSCSGNGCPACAGRGRATTTALGAGRTSRRTSGRAERTAKRSKAKRPHRPGLLGLLGFRKRTPLRRRMKSWLGKTFGTTTARRNAGTSRGGQVVAIGGNPGASWWRCPRCGTSEYSLTDPDVATGRAARHVAATHPGMPFRIDPQ